MDRYLIEISHTPDEKACTEAVRDILELGSHFVTHAEWGCLDDIHTGWLIIEAESHEQARMVLPPADRARAKVIKLTRFRIDDLGELRAHHHG
jgi:hypothetical protein